MQVASMQVCKSVSSIRHSLFAIRGSLHQRLEARVVAAGGPALPLDRRKPSFEADHDLSVGEAPVG
ncbi:MAG TPA: hypothetical protein ENN19_09165 [Chloroflexi bacterium]|nr:hypothetical protein [Chloroflexota bacterium]